MASYKDLEADLHIHSLASGHAYSTISEIVIEAKKKGLKTIAITDHGPVMPGGAHLYYFNNLRVLPEYDDGLRILKGIEANIIDTHGSLDVEDVVLDKLDLVIASFHINCGFVDQGIDKNTKSLMKVLEKNRVHIIGHAGNPLFKLDYDKVASVASEMGVLVEFNNSSYLETTTRKGSEALDLKLALACKKYGTNVVVTSDSHLAQDIGNFSKAWELLMKAGVKEEHILNLDSKRMLEFISKRN